MADLAMLAAKNHGKLIRLFSSGRPLRELAAHAFCMCCKNTGLGSTEPCQSFGRSLLRLAKRRSRLHNYFRIRPDFARWTRELMCSITVLLFEQSKRRSHCGRPGLPMAITPGHLDSYSMNSYVELLGEHFRNIGAKFLRNRSVSIFGSVCPQRKIHV